MSMVFRKRSAVKKVYDKAEQQSLLPRNKQDLKPQHNRSAEKPLPLRQRLERAGLYCILIIVSLTLTAAMVPYTWIEGSKDWVDIGMLWLENRGFYEPVYGFDLNYHDKYPSLKLLEDNFDVLQEEMEHALKVTGIENLPNLPDVAMFKAKMWNVPWRSRK
jgi:hypothetical protein